SAASHAFGWPRKGVPGQGCTESRERLAGQLFMIGSVFYSLSFSSTWILAGLAALPLIWWLLRLTPPRPETVPFPPASLLLGLHAREKTPIRSPWWLTLLRMLIAA